MTVDRVIFPPDFLWGVATSAYQIEGAVNEDGRGETIWDRYTHTPGKIRDGSNGDVACDHYHRWPDDVALMRWLGVDAYRFSIAWSRILPQGRGAVNQAGLDFYSRLVDTLLEANIAPFVTLYHWDLPQALQDQGGWGSRDTADAFAEYADVVARRLGDRVKHWMTHNELWVISMLGHYTGKNAPGLRDLGLALQTAHHLLLSHGLAVQRIRETVHGARVGIAPNYMTVYAASDSAEDQAAARRFDGAFNRWFADPLVGRGYPQDLWDYYGEAVPRIQPDDLAIIASPLDFLGVNYYDPATVAHDADGLLMQTRRVMTPTLERTADREIDPDSFYEMLLRLHRDYAFPAIYVTENGAAFDDEINADGEVHDAARVRFLEVHFAAAGRALAAGVPLRGYFVWSLMDNFEWVQGYTLRYGITYVDYATQRRIPKDSAKWYKAFIAG